jgi:hypothetical protein
MAKDYKGKYHKQKRENYNIKEGLHYFPDDYFQFMFPLGIPEDLKEVANKWYLDYIELMEYRKNPHYGRTQCFRCLLSTHNDDPIFNGVNKVIARGIELEGIETREKQVETMIIMHHKQEAYFIPAK